MSLKTLTILGSTGSIGRQTLEVAEHLGLKVVALTANNNIDLLNEQKEKFKPEIALSSEDEQCSSAYKDKLVDIARNSGADIIVTAIAGTAGLAPALAACETGKRIALANKEPLVCDGVRVMQTAKKHGTEIIPVDSEHSAIFQCLHSNSGKNKEIKRILLTASGGPFRQMSREQLENVTARQALKHPNWVMGQKITIDSATLMNKGLELIEAMHLFDISPNQIEVVVHPESIIHSMVEFTDGSIIAQLSHPDMRMPIQYALTYPERTESLTKPLDITQVGKLTFEKPNFENFPCLHLAYEAASLGRRACSALNKANEEAVELFLQGKIGFYGISDMIERAVRN